MGRSKDEWIENSGGFFANPLESQVRLRIKALSEKSATGELSSAETMELRRLLELLPDSAGDDEV